LTDAAEADFAEIWFVVTVEASEATATRLIDKVKSDREPLRHLPNVETLSAAPPAGLEKRDR
jgi:hypothetical protein